MKGVAGKAVGDVRILILYFSGAGATRYVAQQMNAYLGRYSNTTMRAMEHADDVHPGQYDAIIVGTPVHHAAPAAKVLEYFHSIEPLPQSIPALLFNTKGLYSCNTNRILAQYVSAKNILTVMDTAYRCPASDGSLIAPFVRKFFQFQPDIDRKIQEDCACFLRRVKRDDFRAYIPRIRISGIFNAPNKLAGQRITFRIHLHKEHCIRCGKCAENCPHAAVQADTDGYPLILSGPCENCYRCIHHCPKMALSLSRRRSPQKLPYRQ